MRSDNKNTVRQKPALREWWLGFLFLYFVCNTFSSYSQEKKLTDIAQTKNSTVINGVKFYLHTVEKGQTLYAIAKAYEISLNDIVIENPEAIDGIKPGQILKIQKFKKVEAASVQDGSKYVLHKVEAGQTLYSIAKQYNTTVEKIKILNPELKDGLKGGQTLKMSLIVPKKATEVVTKTNAQIVEKPINAPIEKSIAQSDPLLTIGPSDSLTTFLIENRALDTTRATAVNYTGERKNVYNIAFFLPFHATEANEINIENIIKGDAQLPNKSTIALQFYEGALLAIDSLKKQKLNAKIFIYDVDDHDSSNIVTLLKKPELKEMDLMIGPLYGSSFIPVAKFAKEHSIPIVSPFTQINKILFDNLFVCKVLPSSAMQVEQMAHFVIDSFQKQNIILVNNGNLKEVSFYNIFKNIANKALLKAGYKATDSLKEAKSSAAIESMLNSGKLNVIVLPSNNQSYVTEFISKLNPLVEKNKIILFGLQSWINYDNLDFDYLNKLSVHVPCNNYIDYHNVATSNFTKNYYERFKTDPELYAYQGFDIAYYFISTLQKFGTGFLNNIVETKYQGVETNFNFMQYPLDSGFENKFIYILKYQNNKLVKAN